MKQAKKYKRKYEWCGAGQHKVKQGTVYTARQSTCYQDDESNYFTGCPVCHKYNDDYWDEMWAEYWSSRLC